MRITQNAPPPTDGFKVCRVWEPWKSKPVSIEPTIHLEIDASDILLNHQSGCDDWLWRGRKLRRSGIWLSESLETVSLWLIANYEFTWVDLHPGSLFHRSHEFAYRSCYVSLRRCQSLSSQTGRDNFFIFMEWQPWFISWMGKMNRYHDRQFSEHFYMNQSRPLSGLTQTLWTNVVFGGVK